MREVPNDSDDVSLYIPPNMPTLPKLHQLDISCADDHQILEDRHIVKIVVPSRIMKNNDNNSVNNASQPQPTPPGGKSFLPERSK